MLLQCGMAMLLALVLSYFYRQHNRNYLRLWSKSWLALSVYLLGGVLAESLAQKVDSQNPLRILLSIVTLSGGYLQVVLLLAGAYEIATGRMASSRLLRAGVVMGISLAFVTSLIFIGRPEMAEERFLIRVGLRCFVAGLAFLTGAYWVFYGWTQKKGLGRRLVGISFVLYGLDQLSYLALAFLGSGLISYVLSLMVIDVLLQSAIGLGLVIWLQEEEHEQLLKYSEKLHESEDRYRNVVESQTEMVCRFLPDTTLTFVNDAYCSYFGRRREELIGRKFLELTPATAHDGINRLIDELLSAREVVTNESETLGAGGNVTWTQWFNYAIRNKDGEIVEFQGVGRDITERRQAEGALRESETRNRALLEAIPDILFLHTSDGVYLDIYAANPSALVQNPENLIGSRIEKFLPQEVARTMLDHFDKALRTQEVQVCDYSLELRGELHYFESRIVAFDQDRILRIVRDITKRKQAEEEIQKLASIIEESSEFIGLTSLDGRVLYLNRSGRRFVGLEEDEDITRRHVFDFLADEEQRMISDEVFPSMMNTGSWEGEFYLRHLVTGERIAVRQHAFVIKDAKTGKPISHAHISHDITERRRADRLRERLRAALEKSLGEWRLTFDAIEYPVLILDPERRIRRLNRMARDLLDGQREEIIGCSIEEFDRAQPWKKAAEMAALVQQTRSSFSGHVHDDSDGRIWDISASFFVAPGADDGVMLVARDITTMVQLQESLRRSETMAAMGALVAGVAHEVRNPLFGISATLDAFEARFGDRDDYKRYTAILRGEVERLNALMRGLLEFGKPHDLTVSESSIKSLIARAMTACASLADKSGVEIISEASDDLPRLLVDAQRIIQVFQNLIENAIQHSPRGGVVKIRAEGIVHNEEQWIECEVKDQGPGFPEDDLAKVFKPFFTRRRGGTGLGLSIVQRIVQEHGGAVTAFNESGGGATVKVRLKTVQ